MTDWNDRFTDWQARFRDAQDAGDAAAIEALRDEAAALAREADTTEEAWAAAVNEASAADTPEAARAAFEKARTDKIIPDPVEPPRRALPAARIQGQPADRVLWMAGHSGAILRAGSVAMLAGEGGIAKSALAGGLAAGVAALEDGAPGTAVAGLFDAIGGPALIVAFEDEAAEIADRLRGLVHSPGYATGAEADRILGRVHVLDLAGKPVYGPAESGGRVGFYNQRPGRLSGWPDIWGAALDVRPRLIVIDPATAAYVGNANEVAAVREFLGAVSGEARAIGAGVLIVAHSRKDVRGIKDKDKDDPFDAGHIAGSGAWHDGARAAMTQTWDNDRGPGFRRLALAKANYGPARLVAKMDAVKDGRGAIVGFTAPGGWSEWEPAPATSKGAGRKKPFNMEIA